MKKYLVIFEKTDTGYSAYVPDLPGCVASGSDKQQTEQFIREAIIFHIEGLKLEGLAIPESRSESELLFI